jgi:hypothetical protein
MLKIAKGKRRGKKSGSRGVTFGGGVTDVIKSSHASSFTHRVTNPTDLNAKPRNWLITESPPKNFWNKVYWLKKTVTLVNAASLSTSVPVEGNLSFTVQSLFPEYATILSLFDQYCIHTVVVHLNLDSVGASSGSYGRCTTAIDFDNVANLGGETLVQDFSTAQTVDLSPGLCIERVIQPTVDPVIYQVSGSGYGVGRMWCDSASSSIPHYGFRAFFAQNTISGTTYDVVVTSIIGLRNSI